MSTINSWNNTISDAAVTLNGGAVSIGTDATSNAINIGTGAAARTVTIGNTTGASSVNVDIGTDDFTLASGTGTIISAADTGEINYSLQPAFLAILAANRSNETGNGTLYVINFGTEIFDQNSDFDGTSTFTAPKTGRYSLQTGVDFTGLTAAHTNASITISTSNRSYICSAFSYGAMRSVNNQIILSESVCTDMDAADTAHIQVNVVNGTKVVDINTVSAANPRTYFSGYLAV